MKETDVWGLAVMAAQVCLELGQTALNRTALESTESTNQCAREHPQHTANGESFIENGFELCFGETHLKSTWMTNR